MFFSTIILNITNNMSWISLSFPVFCVIFPEGSSIVFNIPWLFPDWKNASLFSRFSSPSGNLVSTSGPPRFIPFSKIFITKSQNSRIFPRFSRCTVIFQGYPDWVGTLQCHRNRMGLAPCQGGNIISDLSCYAFHLNMLTLSQSLTLRMNGPSMPRVILTFTRSTIVVTKI